MNLNRTILVFTIALSISGCVSTHMERLGNSNYSALNPMSVVTIFPDKSAVGKPFTVVGLIEHYDTGKFQRLELADTYPALQENARSVGANGVVIEKQTTVYSGIFSRGLSIKAIAIKY